jgi:hypothetical protein
MIALDEIELEIASVGEPIIGDAPGHPGAPGALHGHAAAHDQQHGQDAGHHQARKDVALEECRRRVLFLQGVEEDLVPPGDAVLDADIEADEKDEADAQGPG